MRHALYAASAACWLRSAYASASFLVIPCCSASFSAVSAIGNPQYVSVSPAINESSSAPPPSLKPPRAPRITNGACVMFSMPPSIPRAARHRAHPSSSASRCQKSCDRTLPDPHSNAESPLSKHAQPARSRSPPKTLRYTAPSASAPPPQSPHPSETYFPRSSILATQQFTVERQNYKCKRDRRTRRAVDSAEGKLSPIERLDSHSLGVSKATTVSPPFFRASSIENSARLIKSVTISSLSYSCFGTASTIPALNVICVESHGGRNPDAARRNLSARFCAPASVVSGKINARDHEVYFTGTSFCRTIGCSDLASCSKNRSSGDSPCCRKISAP